MKNKIEYISDTKLLAAVLSAVKSAKNTIYATQDFSTDLPPKEYLKILESKINKENFLCKRAIFSSKKMSSKKGNFLKLLPGENIIVNKNVPKQRMILIDEKLLFLSNDNNLFPFAVMSKDKNLIRQALNYFSVITNGNKGSHENVK